MRTRTFPFRSPSRVRLAIAIPLVGVALAAGALPGGGGERAPQAIAAPLPAPGARAVALLATRPGASHTTLHLAPLGAGAVGPAVATLGHLPDAAVRAAVMPGSDTILATADTTPGRDLSFNASLFRLRPHAPPEALCDRVAYASRPLVTASGRVFVSRGVAGPEPAPGGKGRATPLRVDALTVDEIDPSTGAARTVHAMSGQILHLAAAWKNEIVLYRIAPAGADLVAVDADSGAVRPLADMLPYARDFSIDQTTGALVFQERDELDPKTWVIDRMDLATGQRTRLATSPSHGLAPHAWPGGGVAYTPDRRGMALLGAAASVGAPLGPGVDAVQAISPDGAWVAALHTNPSAFGVPFAVRSDTGEVAAIPAPPGSRVAIAGFVAAKGGAP